MPAEARPTGWKTYLAFGIIYFVWGSTYLAIRIGVAVVPPLLYAGLRFLVAGGVLVGWLLARGTPLPSRREWRSAALLAVFLFLMDYGLLFWAEQRIASGVAAVLVATIPLFMTLSELALLHTVRFSWRLGSALLIGLGGVVVLVSHSLGLAGAPIARSAAVALLISAASWSVASVYSRKLRLPESKAMSSGAQMLCGGVWLMGAAAGFGEFRGFNFAAVPAAVWWALAYLIVAGSIIGYTAYVWLLHHEPPSRVSTYAYVNPVVAVVIGYFFGGEPLGPRVIWGTGLVLVSVLVIRTAPGRAAAVTQTD